MVVVKLVCTGGGALTGGTVGVLTHPTMRAMLLQVPSPPPSIEYFIVQWWPVWLAVGGGLMAFAAIREKTMANERRIDALERSMHTSLTDIQRATRKLELHVARTDERTRLAHPDLHVHIEGDGDIAEAMTGEHDIPREA